MVKHAQARRSGQAIVFFILVMVILFFVVLWNFDVHKTLFVKNISQNGGDAAALAAARWQGLTLNLIGDLNIMQALALSAGDTGTLAAVSNIQARLLYVGPMIALTAAQQAAKNNRVHQNDAFSSFLREHADKVRHDYPSEVGPDGQILFPEPYPGAWSEYADMLDAIADDGVAAGPDNMRLYDDGTGGHYLLRIDFYNAVAGRSWCWFYHNAPTLLWTYEDYLSWPPLPYIPHAQYINNEFFGLSLAKVDRSLGNPLSPGVLQELADERDLPGVVTDSVTTTSATWYCYGNLWGSWDAISVEGDRAFPAVGGVRPRYDYAGADAAVRIESTMTRITPAAGGAAASNTITWTAAAKPFGYLGEDQRPNAYGIVLPAFRDVRLIPVDTSSAPSGGSYNLSWRRHIEFHLPDYMAQGPSALPRNCWYCRQLVTWEDPLFRRAGRDWLTVNSARCRSSPGGGGGGPGGGSRRGH